MGLRLGLLFIMIIGFQTIKPLLFILDRTHENTRDFKIPLNIQKGDKSKGCVSKGW